MDFAPFFTNPEFNSVGIFIANQWYVLKKNIFMTLAEDGKVSFLQEGPL